MLPFPGRLHHAPQLMRLRLTSCASHAGLRAATSGEFDRAERVCGWQRPRRKLRLFVCYVVCRATGSIGKRLQDERRFIDM